MNEEQPIKPESIGYWTHRVWNSHHALIQKGVKPFGLTASQAIVFGIIAKYQPLPARDISEHLAISAPAVARQVDALEKRDLVRRSDDIDDERVRLISLTARGEKIWPRISEILHAAHLNAVEGLDPQDVQSLIRYLRCIRQNLESHL
ncbi:MAG: MarR family transcriptional regulator [bacterium]